jgi:hypothetical protein
LISTVRASFAPVPVSGLADQTMLPEVAVLAAPVGAAEPVELADAPAPALVLLLPLLHADTASTAANAAAASANPPLRWRT